MDSRADNDEQSLRALATLLECVSGHERAGLLPSQSMETLALVAAHLPAALEATGAVVWHMDFRTGESGAIGPMDALLDLEPGTFDGKLDTLLSYVHPEDREVVTGSVDTAAARGEFPPLEFRVVRPDGGVPWIGGTAAVAREESGKVTCITGFNMDITHRKSMEEEVAISSGRGGEMAPKYAYWRLTAGDSSGRTAQARPVGKGRA